MSATTPGTLTCTWCEHEFPAMQTVTIPGTKIRLCWWCWKRYQGDKKEDI